MRLTNTIEPFAVGYLNCEREDSGYRIACGMKEAAKHRKLYITRDSIIAGGYDHIYDTPDEPGVYYIYGNGIFVSQSKLDREISQYAEYARELEYIREHMSPLCTNTLVANSHSDTDNKLNFSRACNHDGGIWGGHANPDFEMLLEMGTAGFRRKIEEYRAVNQGRDDFYDGLLLVLDGWEIMAKRYRQKALELSEDATEDQRRNLTRIANALEYVPYNPPRDFFEACQMFWLVCCFDKPDSPGRFDMFMNKYYDVAEENDRIAILDAMWQLFKDSRTWNLCISGSDAQGEDTTSQLCYDILAMARKYRYNTPNLTVRVHKNTPDKLWSAIADTLATGIGMPVIYNDDCVCPAMEELGITHEDAHNYCMNGCNQIDIFGKSHMGLEDGEVCLAKCLQLALADGVCSITGEFISIRTGDPCSFDTYEKLICAYKKQVEFVTDSVVKQANDSQRIYARYAQNPHRSILIQGCVEKCLDYKCGGPVYNHGQILTEGIADTVDSLAAIKHYVYDTGKYTMAQLTDALARDFEGYDELYRDFANFRKFGNDIEYVDSIYRDVLEHFYRYLLTKRTFRGGIYGGGCSTFQRTARYGEMLGAMPNGKKKDSLIIADSIGSVPGGDTNGPTALINSVLNFEHTLAKSGNALNMKFNKATFTTPVGKEAFIAVAKTYFAGGGQQLSVNVVSAEELISAQKDPDSYKNLVVRVGGYSEYFVNLSKGLQDNIIKRTMQ